MTRHSVNNNTRMGLVIISLLKFKSFDQFNTPPPPPQTASNFRHLLSCGTTEQTKSLEKRDPKSVGPMPSPTVKGDPGKGKNCLQKVTGSPSVVRGMVGEDGTGKGRRTSKGLRMNKTVSKSCLSISNCHLFVESFLPSDRRRLLLLDLCTNPLS